MSYYWRYVLWLIAVIGLVVVLIMLLLPGNHKTISGNQFISYSSSNSVASLIIDAPENANSTHQAVKISVSQNSVVYQQLSTYKYNVVNQQSYPNNQTAYKVFLRSLYFANFLRGNTNPADANPYGICPLGDRYIFNFVNNNQSVIHTWTTSCGQKTYYGNANLTVSLFENQVPNFQNLTQNINF